MFPGYQDTTWTYDEEAGAWYYHRFYDFQPDLNMANPRVRQEIEKIIGFWLQLGVAGFRIDAAPFVIELTVPDDPTPRQDFSWLDDFREQLSWRRGDAVILAEANVEPRASCSSTSATATGCRCCSTSCSTSARSSPSPAARSARSCRRSAETPALPPTCQWATFLRNHDEVDLGRLVGHEHDEVFAAFGPDPDMQLYGRGIRRRLAPMLGNDRRRIEMAYALQFTLPGTPVIRYGEEIGMGEDLSLPERNAIRTPMQWSDARNGGFSTARAQARTCAGRSSPAASSATRRSTSSDQQRDPGSLLGWFQRALLDPARVPRVRRRRRARYVDTGAAVGAGARPRRRRAAPCWPLTNLGRRRVHRRPRPAARCRTATRSRCSPTATTRRVGADLHGIEIGPYGYRWIRLRRTMGQRGRARR